MRFLVPNILKKLVHCKRKSTYARHPGCANSPQTSQSTIIIISLKFLLPLLLSLLPLTHKWPFKDYDVLYPLAGWLFTLSTDTYISRITLLNRWNRYKNKEHRRAGISGFNEKRERYREKYTELLILYKSITFCKYEFYTEHCIR